MIDPQVNLAVHEELLTLAKELYPIQRSITGQGVRDTLQMLRIRLPDLNIVEVPSGTPAFDWVVPDEWNVRDAYVMDEEGRKIIDFQQNNLHVLGYATPIDEIVDFDVLDAHLYSLESQPDVIPYVNSYYERRWGFCISHRERAALGAGKYRVYIDSELKSGALTYGELVLPGEEKEEILLSTYTCHPSLANDNVSGITVTTMLAEWLQSQENRRYTYRILFIPETIGAVVYLSKHLDQMKSQTIAGFVLTCVGDDRVYSLIPSRKGDTVADKVARHVLENEHPDYIRYSFLDRGSDERQYCSPSVDLPVVSITRSKYGVFPEYHTSSDNLSILSEAGLGGAYEVYRKCIYILENNQRYKTGFAGEPFLSKHGLMTTLSIKNSGISAVDMLNVWNYCDGQTSLLDIANLLKMPFRDCVAIVNAFLAKQLIHEAN